MTRAAALRNLLLAVFLLLLASALRLHRIDAQSLWFDEGWSAWAAIQPTLAQALLADATNPPLYYLLLNFSTGFLGDSEFSLRLPSLLATLLLIALTWQLAQRYFGRRAAWLAVWLATCSAPLWWAAQEARMYALLALLTLALLLAWQRLLRRPERRAWLLLLFCETFILYTHNTGPVFALWLNLAMLLHWLARRSLRRPDWRAWLAGQALVALLWAPWLLNHFLERGGRQQRLAGWAAAGDRSFQSHVGSPFAGSMGTDGSFVTDWYCRFAGVGAAAARTLAAGGSALAVALHLLIAGRPADAGSRAHRQRHARSLPGAAGAAALCLAGRSRCTTAPALAAPGAGCAGCRVNADEPAAGGGPGAAAR